MKPWKWLRKKRMYVAVGVAVVLCALGVWLRGFRYRAPAIPSWMPTAEMPDGTVVLVGRNIYPPKFKGPPGFVCNPRVMLDAIMACPYCNRAMGFWTMSRPPRVIRRLFPGDLKGLPPASPYLYHREGAECTFCGRRYLAMRGWGYIEVERFEPIDHSEALREMMQQCLPPAKYDEWLKSRDP